MPLALDRDNYIYIMENPFSGREEPLLHILSYSLGFLFKDPIFKLVFIQTCFTSLLILSLIKSSKLYNLTGLVKFLILIFIFFSVFANMLTVQLRIGYAVIIFISLIYFFKKKPSIKNIPYFLIPCLMHIGVIPAVILYYFFHWFNINNYKRFLFIVIFSIIISTFTVTYLPNILETLGFDNYYFVYLDEDKEFGRAIPFSVMLFLSISIPLIICYRKKIINDPDFWFGNFGILLVYTGFVLDLYISFKMLVPFSTFIYIYAINKVLPISNYNSRFILMIILSIMPICFLKLTTQASLL